MKVARNAIIALIIVMIIIISTSLYADDIFTEYTYSTDSDNNVLSTSMVGFNTTAGNWKYGVSTGALLASDANNNAALMKTNGAFKRIKGDFKISGNINMHTNHNWTTFGGDVRVGKKLGNGNGGVAIARGVVDSVNAINARISYNSVGITGDYTLSGVTVSGAVTAQVYSDNNRKQIYKLKVVAPIRNGFSALGLIKIKDADFNPSEYFAPKHQHEELLGLQYRKKYAGWRVSSKLLLGTQHLGSGAGGSETVFTLIASKPINKNLHIKLLYDLLDLGGAYPYKWEMYSVKLKYMF